MTPRRNTFRKVTSAKCPDGKMSQRLKFLTGKCSVAKLSRRRNGFRQNVFRRKVMQPNKRLLRFRHCMSTNVGLFMGSQEAFFPRLGIFFPGTAQKKKTSCMNYTPLLPLDLSVRLLYWAVHIALCVGTLSAVFQESVCLTNRQTHETFQSLWEKIISNVMNAYVAQVDLKGVMEGHLFQHYFILS